MSVFNRLATQPAFWVPAFLQRSFDLTLVQAGQFMGAQLLLTGVLGVYAGGWFDDRIGHMA